MRLITVDEINAYIRPMGERSQFSFYRDPEGFMNSTLAEDIAEVTPYSVFYKIAQYLANQHFVEIDQTEIDWIMDNPVHVYLVILLVAQRKDWGVFPGDNRQGAHNIWLEMIDGLVHSPKERPFNIDTEQSLSKVDLFRKDLTAAAESLPYMRIFSLSPGLRAAMINDLVNGGTPTIPLQDLINGINTSPSKEVCDWYVADPGGLRLLVSLFADSRVWGRSEPGDEKGRSYHAGEVAKLILAGDYMSRIPAQESVEKPKEEKINFITYLHEVTCSTKRNKYIVTTKWAEIMQRYLSSAKVNLAEWTGFATWVIKPSEEPNKEAYSFIEKFGDVHGAIRMALITCSTHEGHGIPPVGPCRSGYYQVDQKEIEELVKQWDMWLAEDVTDQRREDDIESILRIVANCTDERDLKTLVGEAVCQFDQVHGENALQDNLCGPIIANDSRMPVWMYLIGYMHAKREQVHPGVDLSHDGLIRATVESTAQFTELKEIFELVKQRAPFGALAHYDEQYLELIAKRIVMFRVPFESLKSVINGLITKHSHMEHLQHVIQYPELCSLLAGVFMTAYPGLPMVQENPSALGTAIDTFYNMLTYTFNVAFDSERVQSGIEVFDIKYLVRLETNKWFINV